MLLKEEHAIIFIHENLFFWALETKVSQTTSCVPMRSLLWAHHKVWTPIGFINLMHTHLAMPIIKRCKRFSRVQSAIKNITEDN